MAAAPRAAGNAPGARRPPAPAPQELFLSAGVVSSPYSRADPLHDARRGVLAAHVVAHEGTTHATSLPEDAAVPTQAARLGRAAPAASGLPEPLLSGQELVDAAGQVKARPVDGGGFVAVVEKVLLKPGKDEVARAVLPARTLTHAVLYAATAVRSVHELMVQGRHDPVKRGTDEWMATSFLDARLLSADTLAAVKDVARRFVRRFLDSGLHHGQLMQARNLCSRRSARAPLCNRAGAAVASRLLLIAGRPTPPPTPPPSRRPSATI